MDQHDRMTVQILIESFSLQRGWYKEMATIAEKTLGHLVLSRGDVSQLRECVEKKQRLVKLLEDERNRTSEQVIEWQGKKNSMQSDESVKELDSVLADTQSAIKEFLDKEEQLKRYISTIIRVPSAV